jgi:hypothetical protein
MKFRIQFVSWDVIKFFYFESFKQTFIEIFNKFIDKILQRFSFVGIIPR